jgi:hypothetical protein
LVQVLIGIGMVRGRIAPHPHPDGKLAILREPITAGPARLDDIATWVQALALILLDWERIGRQACFVVSSCHRRSSAQCSCGDGNNAGMSICLVCRWVITPAGSIIWSARFFQALCPTPNGSDQKRMDNFRANILFAIMPVFSSALACARTNWDVGGIVAFAAARLYCYSRRLRKIAGVHLADGY